ncbi:MAG: hypothetical protein QM680_02225 [Luteolibacter sp.]
MKTIFLTSLLAFAAVLSSCNTMIGVGRDTRILGEAMENQANKSRGGGDSSSQDNSGAPVY